MSWGGIESWELLGDEPGVCVALEPSLLDVWFREESLVWVMAIRVIWMFVWCVNGFGFDSIYLWLFLWLFLFIVFSVKYPLWPLHSWLPEVHVEASTEISCILASVILKVGFFGMYKFLVVNVFLSTLFLGFIDFIVLFGLFMVSMVLMFNVDYKKVIAFWSVLHTGISVLLFWYNDFLFITVVIFCNFSFKWVYMAYGYV